MNQPVPFINSYRELRSPSVRGTARHFALNALSFAKKIRGVYESTATKNCVQILLLHHLFPDEEENFNHLLERLTNRYQFISYSEAVERILTSQIDKSYLAFSFDDGLKTCLKAAEILQRWGATACFFVCPQIVGETNSEKIRAFCQQQLWHGPVEFMDWDDLACLKSQGHEIGGHSTGHFNLAEMTMKTRAKDLMLTKSQIEEHLSEVIHFAWPYGQFQHCTSEAMQQVFTAGFQSIASGVRGAHANEEPLAKETICLRRESIEAAWPVSHVEYFLAESNRNPLGVATTPAEWQPARAA